MKRAVLLAMIAALAVVGVTPTVVGAKSLQLGTSEVLSNAPNGALWLAPRHDLPSKSDWNPTADAAAIRGTAGSTVAPMSCELGCTVPLSGYGSRLITPPGGSANNINEQYSASVYHLGAYKATNTGTSSATWMGTNPYYASQVGNIDTFTVAVVGLASISLPPGTGWSVGSNSATYNPGNVFNNWGNSHDWRGAGVSFTAGPLSNLVNMSEAGQGNFLFGSSWFPVDAQTNTVWF